MEPLEWTGDSIRILDQSRLPHEVAHLRLARPDEVAEAIGVLRIRGAPLIGIAGAYGLALCGQAIEADSPPERSRSWTGRPTCWPPPGRPP